MRDVNEQIDDTESLILSYLEKVTKDLRALKDKKIGFSNNTVRFLREDADILADFCVEWNAYKRLRDALPDSAER